MAQLFTSGWVQYAFALSYIPVVALDWAGLWVPLPSFLHLLVLLGLVPIQLGLLLWRWRHSFWSVFGPLLALVLALVFGHDSGGRLGAQLIRYRFESNRVAYDTVADQVLRGSYPKELRPEHRRLGYWVKAASGPEKTTAPAVLGVSFLVVSHGFAGHVGFVRLADQSSADRLLKQPPPGGWDAWLGQLDGPWYLVAN
ncbi:MAG: hypothetical protein QM756_42970 [Polyangiaceae bacterium]